MKGVFITFEGGEGAGKSTVARRLAAALQTSGQEVVLTREPGGTQGAEAVRGLLLDPATQLTPLADTLLHFAARADHVARVINPALARGAVVICDRFYDSTMAYQGYGLGVDKAAIVKLIGLVGLIPDLTFVLEVSESTTKQRLASRGNAADRYELMGAEVMARIAAGFHEIALTEPARCVLVDANAAADAVFARVAALVAERLGL
ncbi:MAG: dTMP kinase [Acidocella sp. 35-58-6]|nr:MAG: dTMP kinase [Acidocella sp. 35-58-6]